MKKIICRDIYGKEFEVNSSELSLRISVYGLLIENGKILLSPQWDGYDFPGGGLEMWEDFDEGIEREVFEETGIKVKKGELLFCKTDYFIHPFSKKPLKTVLIYFLCKKIGGEISSENFDENEKNYAQKALWLDLEEAKNLKYYNPVNNKELIEKAIKISTNTRKNI